MVKIPFNRPFLCGGERRYIEESLAGSCISGSGRFVARASELLQLHLGSPRVMLTPSCTSALEMAALLLDLGPDDEVLVPSFTFVSTVNAIVLRGARPVFVDIRPDTKNIDLELARRAVTDRTRAIFLVHYAAYGCEMEGFTALAAERGLELVEDAAQCVGASYRGRPLGSFGALSTFSFHETKNVICGEGGALAVNDPELVPRAEIIQEKGTNRSQFFRGEVDKYTWVDVGSSFLLGDLPAAFLLAQLESMERINAQRLALWHRYRELLAPLAEQGRLELPPEVDGCEHNGHIFYVLLPDRVTRDRVMDGMKARGIQCVFHYQPLHAAPMGQRYGYGPGDLPVTERVADTLLRLPLFGELTLDEVQLVADELSALV
ncbi:MAG: dTDP-4-amino-4,6-dideoxygalactose transaminase [Deltaproteobacteria bacterium]|nr:dTDP-4-amino-4,6-dideoxygalactose transaminase [Deltaproteobacteria bacterium]